MIYFKYMYVPLGSTVAFTVSICLYYILGNYGHARSRGGRQTTATKPPLYVCMRGAKAASASRGEVHLII